MHTSALTNAKHFFNTYAISGQPGILVDIGSQNVNGSLKDVAPSNLKYIGVDFVQNKGVDVILEDPYILPFEKDSVDFVVCSSCLEHSEMFWVLFLEIMRIMRPEGLFYMNVPTNGPFHRYPVDCWRFYPDSAQALVNWAKRNGYQPEVLESFVSDKDRDIWNDYVGIFIKDGTFASRYPARVITSIKSYTNARVVGSNELICFRAAPEDQWDILTAIKCRYWKWKARNRERLNIVS